MKASLSDSKKKKIYLLSLFFVFFLMVGYGSYNLFFAKSNDELEDELNPFGNDEEPFLEITMDEGYIDVNPNSGDHITNSTGGTELDYTLSNLEKYNSKDCTRLFKEGYDPSNSPIVILDEETGEPFVQTCTPIQSQIENQRDESLCWAYSFTTAVEGTISRRLGKNVELSVKHLDYLLSNKAGDENPYDAFYKAQHNGKSRSPGSSSNNKYATMASTGKYTLIEDQTFWNRLKSKDPELSDYTLYGDFLEENPLGYKKPVEKNAVFGQENQNQYNLLGYEVVSSGYPVVYKNEFIENNTTAKYLTSEYADLTDDEYANRIRGHIISNLKEAIYLNGAIGFDTHFNPIEPGICGAKTAGSAFFNIILDKTTLEENNNSISISNKCGSGAVAHSVSLVGWDDNLTYTDGEETKKGAFIVQDSYGDPDPYHIEYLAYDSTIPGYFIAWSVENMWDEETQTKKYDHVYDFTDQTPSTSESKPNELVFGFETPEENTEKIERISFVQRQKMEGIYMVFLRKKDGENWGDWQYLHTFFFSYPGLQSVKLSNKGIEVNGSYELKVYSGYNSSKSDVDCTGSCNESEKEYVGDPFTDTEKKFDTMTVYTKNSSRIVTVTRGDGISLDKESVFVPYGTKIVPENNSLVFKNDEDEEIDRITATLSIEEDSLNTFSVLWNLNSSTVSEQTEITATIKRTPKKFRISFVNEYKDKDNNLSRTVLEEKEVSAGEIPVFTGSAPTRKSDREGISYVFSGWEPELTEVSGSAEYKASFSTVYTKYQVKYVLNGGTNNSKNPTTYTLKDDIILWAPTKQNSIFLGWFETADFSGKEVTEILFNSTGDLTLYAKWQSSSNNSNNNPDEEEGTLSDNKDEQEKNQKEINNEKPKNPTSENGLGASEEEPEVEDIPNASAPSESAKSTEKVSDTGKFGIENSAIGTGILTFGIALCLSGIVVAIIWQIKNERTPE